MLTIPGWLMYLRMRLPTRHEKYLSHVKIPSGHISLSLFWGSGFRVKGAGFRVNVMDKGLGVSSNGCELGQGGSLKIDEYCWNVFRDFFTEGIWTYRLEHFQETPGNCHLKNRANLNQVSV